MIQNSNLYLSYTFVKFMQNPREQSSILIFDVFVFINRRFWRLLLQWRILVSGVNCNVRKVKEQRLFDVVFLDNRLRLLRKYVRSISSMVTVGHRQVTTEIVSPAFLYTSNTFIQLVSYIINHNNTSTNNFSTASLSPLSFV